MTVAFVAGNQKEWKAFLSFTNVAHIVFPVIKAEPLMDNISGGSNSYYYHIYKMLCRINAISLILTGLLKIQVFLV